MAYKKYDVSVMVLDTRNFTDNLIYFINNNDDSFIEFIEDIWQTGFNVSDVMSNGEKNYCNSTGDGFVSIFFGPDHEKRAYLCSMLLYHILNKKCDIFGKAVSRNMSFGIGIESGQVQEIKIESEKLVRYTYVGNVVNKAARIEAETKSHARAQLLLGDEINWRLVKQLYNEDYRVLMNHVKQNPNNKELVIEIINKLNGINQKLLLSFIFEHNLKGVDEPVPLFRLSPTLANLDNPGMFELVRDLADEAVLPAVEKMLKEAKNGN